MRFVTIASSLVLIAFGIVLLSNNIGWLASFFPNFGIKM
jgi:hypothetical protein